MKIDVKWGKSSYSVDADTSQPPSLFKAVLFSLTGVPVDRQKITVKGGLLKDDQDWATTGLKEGSKVMMMGTAEAIPEAPKEVPEAAQQGGAPNSAAPPRIHHAGLDNLGNTCYANATIQCLYTVPELRSALAAYPTLPSGLAKPVEPPTHALTVATRELFKKMETSDDESVTPLQFMTNLRKRFAQFDQTGQGGLHSQQDAEECWTQLMLALRDGLDQGTGKKSVDDLFGLDLVTTLRCPESGEEQVDSSHQYMMKCNIDQTVNNLFEGLQLALKEDREKSSDKLGRTVKWEGESRVARLPRYLTVQQVRFFYKREIQTKAKMLRAVAFPALLDVYPLCSPELKAQLDVPRAAEQEAREREVMEGRGGTKKAKLEDSHMEVDAAGPSGAGAAPTPTPTPAAAPASDPSDKPLTGRYELCAVLTHKGRTADSGHYEAWVRCPDGSWAEYDDDRVTPRKEEEILRLSGGGDWHMSYLLIYRAA